MSLTYFHSSCEGCVMKYHIVRNIKLALLSQYACCLMGFLTVRMVGNIYLF